MRGKFIVIEGLDGSGKSTQAKKLAQSIPNSLLTREPSDNNIGALCRAAFSKELDLSLQSIMLLLIADRIEHLEKIVVPALEAGRDVICDRYYLSNMAYQGQHEREIKEIYELNKKFGAPVPDLTIFLSIEPEKALERIKARSSAQTVFEELQKLKKIHENYGQAIQFLREQGEMVVEIPAVLSEDEVAAEILRVVTGKLSG